MADGDLHSPAARAAAVELARAALLRVQDPATGRVRVEDYLTVLGSMTGESALIAAGVIEIESSLIAPGSALFGDQINRVLTGDTTDLAAVPGDTVVGLLVSELVPGTVDLAAFDSLEKLYQQVAAGIGSVPWGAVPLRVPRDNEPTVLPLQVAFELRPVVDAAVAELGLPQCRRHIPCAMALADALKQVHQAIDVRVALSLSLQVVFGTAKMAPMSKRAYTQAADGRP